MISHLNKTVQTEGSALHNLFMAELITSIISIHKKVDILEEMNGHNYCVKNRENSKWQNRCTSYKRKILTKFVLKILPACRIKQNIVYLLINQYSDVPKLPESKQTNKWTHTRGSS